MNEKLKETSLEFSWYMDFSINYYNYSIRDFAKLWDLSDSKAYRIVKKFSSFTEETRICYERKIKRWVNDYLDSLKPVKVNKEGEITHPAPQGPTELIYPYNTEEFKKAWHDWIEYKWVEHKDRYKSLKTQQIAINKLAKEARDQDDAIEMIRDSMASRWHGIYRQFNKVVKTKDNEKIKKLIADNKPILDINKRIQEYKEKNK